jgi:hypothetical protein
MAFDVFTGPRCRFTMGGGPVLALGRNVAASEEIVYEPLDVLNNIESLDHVPVGYRASLSASEIVTIGQTLEAKGLYPKKGQTPQTFLRNILTLPELTSQIEDDITDTVVARAFGAKLGTRNFSVDPRGMVPQELSFVCRRVLGADEAN